MWMHFMTPNQATEQAVEGGETCLPARNFHGPNKEFRCGFRRQFLHDWFELKDFDELYMWVRI